MRDRGMIGAASLRDPKIVFLFGVIFLALTGCSLSFGPEKAGLVYAPTDRDIYLQYSALWKFKIAYTQLKKEAPTFAEKKCGRNSNFTLNNFFVKEAEVRGLTGVAPVIAASIVCLPKNAVDPNLLKSSREKALKRCQEIGLSVGSKFYNDCVQAGSR